jgi:outer membrane protein assembly factor BamB
MFRGEGGRGVTPNAINPPLAIKWQLRLQLEDEAAKSFNPPIIIGDTIYFGSFDGNFYALDVKSGYMRWVFKTSGHINSVPFGDSTNVYFGSDDGLVYAVRQEDGEQSWSFDTEHAVQSTFLKYNDLVVVTSNMGACHFISPAGEEVFSLPNYGWIRFSFQIYYDIMYFAPGPETNLYSLAAYDLKAEAFLWFLQDQVYSDATWYSFPVVEGDRLYFSTCAFGGNHLWFNYYALDRMDGRVIWDTEEISLLNVTDEYEVYSLLEEYVELLDYMAPVLWQGLVIYTSGDRIIRAFYADNGVMAWQREFAAHTSSAPTVAGDRLYFGLNRDDIADIAPQLVCLSARDGRTLWTIELEGSILSAPVIASNWIVFGTDKHLFYVLEEVF